MVKENIVLLREVLSKIGFQGFLVPRADAWPGEFVSESAERLKWLSGFSGSAGIAVVLQDEAVVLTDGRYTTQIKNQVNGEVWETDDISRVPIAKWLKDYAPEGARIGYDPWLHSKASISKLIQDTKEKRINFVAVSENPIDNLWQGRPPHPSEKVSLFSENLAGQSSAEKRKQLGRKLVSQRAQAAIFSSPDSIAWFLNIRGGDVLQTPVPLSYAILKDNGSVLWFLGADQVPGDIHQHLGNQVSIHSFDDLSKEIKNLKGSVLLDESRTPARMAHLLEEHGVSYKHHEDLTLWTKASKTEAEQEAIRKAHFADARALSKFHDWIKKEVVKDQNNELTIEEQLEKFRQEQRGYQGPSFSPIVGFNENGAVIHYRATEETNREIEGQGLLLVDSGGQYYCEEFAGTTDITRTYAIGSPTREQKKHYTLVLKAHLAVSMAKFPYGTTGAQIDAIARNILWQEELDFQHGLGHGVGCFLNVHEDSANLSPRGKDKLEPGMLLSNEPGLYFEGEYGIRIENLIFVQKTGDKDHLGRDVLCFETVTFASYDEDPILWDMLNEAEVKWIKSYHQKIGDLK